MTVQLKPPPSRQAPSLTCVIAATARTGSYFLADLMKNTGLLGYPREFFNPHIENQILVSGMADPPPAKPDTVARRCALVDANGTSANGVAAFKLFPPHFHWMLGGVRLSEWFPNIRWIHLSRDDKVGQAISWSIARQTAVWWGRRDEAGPTPVYSASEIEMLLLEILAEEADWAAYFLRNDIRPLRLSYETMVREPAGTVAAIADFAGVALKGPPALGSTTTKQRGPLEEEWRSRFMDDAGSIDRLDPPFLPRYAPRNARTLFQLLKGRLPIGFLPERWRS